MRIPDTILASRESRDGAKDSFAIARGAGVMDLPLTLLITSAFANGMADGLFD